MYETRLYVSSLRGKTADICKHYDTTNNIMYNVWNPVHVHVTTAILQWDKSKLNKRSNSSDKFIQDYSVADLSAQSVPLHTRPDTDRKFVWISSEFFRKFGKMVY